DFTWTVQFSGLSPGDAAGLPVYGQPAVGTAPAYWYFSQGWVTVPSGQGSFNFGAKLIAVERGAVLRELSTVTNMYCNESFTATRTWQATDACGNASTCSQTVSAAVPGEGSPSFDTQPANQVARPGDTTTFSANVSGCTPIGYQW